MRFFAVALFVWRSALPRFARYPAGKRKKRSKPAPPDVLVIEAATRDVPVYREWIGTIDGSENAEIRARVTGYLIKRDYQEGCAGEERRPPFRDRSAAI